MSAATDPSGGAAGFVNPITDRPIPVDLAGYADAVAAAVRAVPGVVGLHTGAFGEVATYLPGRRVDGVQVRPGGCSVHLVLAWGAPVLATADLVRAVVSPLVGTPVDITVEDVVGPQGSVHVPGRVG